MNLYFVIIIGSVFVNNFVLSQFLGICPFLGVSKKTNTALGMGFAVIFVMSIASVFTYLVNEYVLVKLGLEYMKTIAFILIIAALVQSVEIVIKKFSPSLYSALGVYLPLITTNCAVLGVALLNVEKAYNLLQSFLNGVFAGVGFTLAIVLLAGVRERIVPKNVPEPFRGFPITLIAAALLSMAFSAFSGMFGIV
ncbi:MAG TPA: electron transport complex subunit RsxA [Clostridiales bacterium]|nr:electron transport complex subunit RsxA [Clostridiales bacterium]